MARLLLTENAVQRFKDLYARALTVREARRDLEEKADHAIRLRERTVLGQEQWELQDGSGAVLVVKDCPEGRVCVTVHTGRDPFFPISEEELEIIREASARMPPLGPKEEPDPGYKPKPVDLPKKPVVPSVKTLNQHLPQKTNERFEKIASLHLELLKASNTKALDKMTAHIERMELESRRQKRCLRSALRYLLSKAAEGDQFALEIAQEIQEQDPGFTTQAFLMARRAKKVANQ